MVHSVICMAGKWNNYVQGQNVVEDESSLCRFGYGLYDESGHIGKGYSPDHVIDVVPFVGVTTGLVRRYGKFRAVPGLDAGVQVKLKVASSLYLYAEPKVGIRTDTYDGSEQGRPDRVASMVGGLLYRFKMPTFQ